MAIIAESSMKVVEDVSHVSPPPGSVPTTSLSLAFFDLQFLGSSPFQRLFFYEFHTPSSYFMQTTIPSLKSSLSLALKRFFPYAGNLVFPPPPQIPYILYTDGDSVLFFVNESAADFSHLVGHHPRHFHEFQPLLPKLPPAVPPLDGMQKKPLMAVQVTLFPNQGVSIGVSFIHVAGDGRTLAHFMKSWASLHRSQVDFDEPLPDFDSRGSIEDPLGLASFFLNQKWSFEDLSNNPIDKFQVTYNIKRSQVEFLKDQVKKSCISETEMEAIRISTFVVTCAYMWVSLIKLQASPADDLSDELSHFLFAVDCRRHLKLPATYFGNCTIARTVAAKRSELIGEDGFLAAAKAIGREVMEIDKGPLKGAETSPDIFRTEHPPIMVSASPKFRLYGVDFGWGRPRKTEVASLGSLGSLFCFLLQRAGKKKVVLNLA
ncbi:Detected protein of unknown function [Hibiscus syriacus]|uniref:Uncharacterized protein n=1 Tax=Hibiscus syriacus TaxID=106335 RepID=A0A6A3AMQ6_HIBSY|nr:coumaroyl-CoA:anthocyanidin 3-O-glucoside-6''-O-coumaroyltransferase 1-like [Hibiscus syriacus]KAE8705894.1 Detected protein of unknown function [Hibiscus syriacus]